MIRSIMVVGACAWLAACAADGGGKAKTASSEPSNSAPGKGKGYSHDPYPSTYHAYPGAPTLVTNVTVLDGEGGRIDNGSVLFHITIGERDAWGRGYGGEATSLMVDHALGSLGLHRVALSVFAFNERAIRAYERVGFVHEGRAREAIWRDGRWWDEIHMSVLEPEWRARRWQERAVADGRTSLADAEGAATPNRGG